MAIKGQKFKNYSDEIKKEAIRLHVEERWTYRKITEHFEIQDQGRVKRWMKKYRELGEFGLLDQRGRRIEYIDQDRYVQKLKRENEMLKKCLEIWMQEVKRTNIESLRTLQKSMPLATCVNSLGSLEVDTTLS
ncbi:MULTISPECIES: helix-turn-helix domain-containing protein [Paenibacillus]|uniref:Transposase n=1 Tax=Paenibacillus odorifer TaxID=189426 RepID=A0A1R0Y5J2_9BACL|nr:MULTISPECIES: helix-turn-helix domain-containing protein [Paenibacillus]AIQ33356.1 transposase [Paenibacillus sp. FSL R5-0345]AIQ34019.1 transposase [Paenibacillus sp. FSL R5-0345]AIQ34307.1 transposase [Paenibacillus sp. FSL R5-0345]AIQ35915.1 transposase [Paenibacillus sp. FSL R5-0345]AIQ36709.1 transposase [Paenibacillus sp. FSL R5-0345]